VALIEFEDSLDEYSRVLKSVSRMDRSPISKNSPSTTASSLEKRFLNTTLTLV
jgi:hypothetical protein